MVAIHRAKALRDRIFSSLAYHMRHRNDDGVLQVIKVEKFQLDAGGRDALTQIVRHLCTEVINSGATTHMHPKDRERWARWGMRLL